MFRPLHATPLHSERRREPSSNPAVPGTADSHVEVLAANERFQSGDQGGFLAGAAAQTALCQALPMRKAGGRTRDTGAAIASALVALALLGVPATGTAAAATRSPAPLISGFRANPGVIGSLGGSVTVGASVTGASTCRLTGTNALAGVSQTFSCGPGAFRRSLSVPSNGGTAPVTSMLVLSAVGSGNTSATTSVTVDAQSCSNLVPYANLSSCSIQSTTPTPLDLEGINLKGADLVDATLTDVDLTGSNFTDADLAGAALSAVDLTGAKLMDTNLGTSTLSGVNLAMVDLSGATFTGATTDDILQNGYSGAVVSGGIRGIPAVLPVGWAVVDGYLIAPWAGLVDADLSGVDLVGLDLPGANLNGANLSDADLAGDDLASCAMPGADLSGADLDGASAQNANLVNATAENTNFSNVSLVGGQLEGADFQGSTFTEADLVGVSVSDTNFKGTHLFKVATGGIFGAPSKLPIGWRFVDGYFVGPWADLGDSSNLAGADLSGLDLTGIDFGPLGLALGTTSLVNANLSHTNFTRANFHNADVDGANLTGANLTRAAFLGASLNGVLWSDTICPDGTNSDNDGGTCDAHLT
jgi:uncharacterized protein YjbI with pentapeptide repeats